MLDDFEKTDPFNLDFKSQVDDFFATTMPCSPKEPIEFATKKTKKSKKLMTRKPSITLNDPNKKNLTKKGYYE